MPATSTAVGSLLDKAANALREWWLDLVESQGCTCSPSSHPLPSGVIVPPCELHGEAVKAVQPPWI
jgi:hypothetical protein